MGLVRSQCPHRGPGPRVGDSLIGSSWPTFGPGLESHEGRWGDGNSLRSVTSLLPGLTFVMGLRHRGLEKGACGSWGLIPALSWGLGPRLSGCVARSVPGGLSALELLVSSRGIAELVFSKQAATQ